MPEVVSFFGVVGGGRGSDIQQFARHREAGLRGSRRAGPRIKSGAGSVPDAVEAAWQDMERDAADELVGAERHDLLAINFGAALVLVVEGNKARVEGDQSGARDRDPVRVARQVGEHRLRSGEQRLGIDDQRFVRTGARWCRKARRSARFTSDPNKSSRPASCSATRRVRDSRRNSLPSTRTGSRNVGLDDIQRLPDSAMPPPGTIMCRWGWWAPGVVGDAPLAAVLDVTAERRRAAVLDHRDDLELGEAQVTGMSCPIGRPCRAEDVGDLDRGAHA